MPRKPVISPTALGFSEHEAKSTFRIGFGRMTTEAEVPVAAQFLLAPSGRREGVSESPILVHNGFFEGVNHGRSKLVSLSQDLPSGLAPQ
jgi:hypothetical protein